MVPDSVLSEWRRLSRAGINNRAAAAALRMSEAALVGSACGTSATRLVPDARALLEAARALGRAKFVVRNDYAVLERSGEIDELGSSLEGMLMATGAAFTLRLAPHSVCSAFALEEPAATGVKRSLQLFDAAGVSVVKLVFRGEEAAQAFAALSARLGDPDPLPRETAVQPGAARLSADAASALAEGALAAFLRRASQLCAPLRLEVGNGCASLQTSSAIRRVKRSSRAPWINVLDPELDLHLYEARIDKLAVRADAAGFRWLHWLAEDGSCAFSAEVPTAFVEWVSEASPPINGLQERALED